MRLARPLLMSSFALAGLAACGDAQPAPPVTYELTFANREHHETVITAHFAALPSGPLELRMSRSSPGRYALHEFAKNVYDVRATGAGGRAVEVTRPDPYGWEVAGHGGDVTVTYTLYGDWADGTYDGIDRTHAHLNMPATFMWARGLGDRPIEVTVHVPDGSGWRVATQLAPTEDPDRFTAPNLYYFMDSPMEIADFWMHEWELDGHSMRVALHHAGTEAEAERYAEAAEAIVRTARDIYGELPAYDFGTYTFLACYLPWTDGDGMEHRNSTVLTSPSNLATNMIGLLGTVAHEYFHSWNIERIRPTTIEPFDFERANMSSELWFGEGFTSYFDDLILWRADLISSENFAQRMGGIADAVTNARGRQHFSAVEMSMQAPFVDAATAVDPNNRDNTFLSYYTWGSGIALGLDLTLRERFDGVTLDDLMREMWRTYGVTERSYAVDDIQAALGRVTGDAAFAADFFDRYVRGHEAPDYPALLRAAGVELGPSRPDAGWLGSLSVAFDGGAAVVQGTPIEETPFYRAGLDRADRITSINGTAPRDRVTFDRILAGLRQGDSVEIRWDGRGESRSATVRAIADPALAARWLPDAMVTPEQAAVRTGWKRAPRG